MRRAHRALTAVAAAASVLSLTATGLVAATPAEAVDGPTAQVWVTSRDGTQKMTHAAPVAFTPGGSDALTVTVDPTREYQTMRGFGASITDSSAHLLAGLPKSRRDAVMADLFGPAGNRLSVLRQPMGASDFVAGDFYTYDDVPAGQTDYDLSKFSINHDRAEILPLVRQAIRLNPDITVVASPWSPPAWMKTNGDLVGGRLIDEPRIYAAYAQYFVKFVQAYAAARVPVHAVTLQNEPQNRNPRSYPGMGLPAWQETKLAVAVDEAFAAAGLRTKILGYDHNWATHPDDLASTPPGEDPEADYPYRLLESSDAGAYDGIAYHCYAGEPLDQTKLHDAHPDTELWFTECSGSHGASDPPAKFFADTLTWHARNLVMGVTRNWGSTVVNWNLALDPSGGPHNGGCDTCTGVVTVGPKNTVTRNAEYYTLGHLARFVDPGAVRVASTSYGTTGWNGKVMSVAFRNPDGSIVLLAHNENDAPSDFAVAQGGQSFDYTLPGGALATFVWDDSAALDDGFDLAAVDAATATSTTNGTGTGNAVDDDGSTAWTTGTAQTPGQELTVDLGVPVDVRKVVLDAGFTTAPPEEWWTPGIPSTDYPRGVRLLTSTDGDDWTPVSTATGGGQLTTLTADGSPVRWLRLEVTTSSDSWWSVADLRVHT